MPICILWQPHELWGSEAMRNCLPSYCFMERGVQFGGPENRTVTHFPVTALKSPWIAPYKLMCIIWFSNNIEFFYFWLKDKLHGKGSNFSFFIMSQVLLIWVHLCHFGVQMSWGFVTLIYWWPLTCVPLTSPRSSHLY